MGRIKWAKTAPRRGVPYQGVLYLERGLVFWGPPPPAPSGSGIPRLFRKRENPRWKHKIHGQTSSGGGEDSKTGCTTAHPLLHPRYVEVEFRKPARQPPKGKVGKERKPSACLRMCPRLHTFPSPPNPPDSAGLWAHHTKRGNPISECILGSSKANERRPFQTRIIFDPPSQRRGSG